MKIFLTGATGFVGSAIVDELVRRGHRVIGLARNGASADKLRRKGIAVHAGDVLDIASVVAGARAADAVIHTAFDHDLSRFLESCRRDGEVLMAMAQALANSGRTLVATSATPVTTPAPVSTEDLRANPEYPRSASEQFLEFADRGVFTCVVRLPMSVHGSGNTALIPALVACARSTGVSALIGGGTNRWSAVHRYDAARLYCDAVEKPQAGTRFHAVHDEGVAFREIASRIGGELGLPTTSLSPDMAAAHFGWLARFVMLDSKASSELTRKVTGWRPREADLLSDIVAGSYFTDQRATPDLA